MLIFKRFSPYWSTALVVAALVYGYTHPVYWLPVGVLLFCIPVLSVLVIRQKNWGVEYVGLSAASIVLLLAAFGFILIQESHWIINTVIVVTAVFHFLFLKHLIVFLFDPSKYITYSMEHVSKYSNVVASFFLYVSIFIFYILGIGRLRYLLLVALVTTAVLVWQTFWIQKLPWHRTKWFVFIITLIMMQGVWALHFWPVSFFVSGFTLTIGLYIILNLARHYLTDSLSRSLIIRYVVTSSVAVLILLVTARWV